MRANKIVSAIILMCFLLNAAVSDLAFGLATPSTLTNIMGMYPKDMGRVKLALEEELVALEHSGLPMNEDTFRTILNNMHLQERTIFQPADMQFFFREIKLTYAGLCVMVRLKDKYGIRTYYATFYLQKDEKGGFPIKVYTEEQYKSSAEFRKVVPYQTKAEDAKAIERYVQHEKGIDEIIKYAFDNGLVIEPSPGVFDLKRDLPELLDELNVSISNPNGLIPIQNRKIYAIDREGLPDEMQKKLGKITILDDVGNEFTAACYSHASNNAIYVFMPSKESLSVIAGQWAQPAGELTRVMGSLIFKIHLLHEIGVICGLLPVKQNFMKDNIPEHNMTENELDRRFGEVNHKGKNPIDFQKLDLSIVNLDENLTTRDYAAGKNAQAPLSESGTKEIKEAFARALKQQGITLGILKQLISKLQGVERPRVGESAESHTEYELNLKNPIIIGNKGCQFIRIELTNHDSIGTLWIRVGLFENRESKNTLFQFTIDKDRGIKNDSIYYYVNEPAINQFAAALARAFVSANTPPVSAVRDYAAGDTAQNGGGLGSLEGKDIAELIKNLLGDNAHERLEATKHFSIYGSELPDGRAKDQVIAALLRALANEKDDNTRAWMIGALGEIGSEVAVISLQALLPGGTEAIRSLAKIGASSKTAEDVKAGIFFSLTNALNDANAREIAQALYAIGPASNSTLRNKAGAFFIKALDQATDNADKSTFAFILGRLGLTGEVQDEAVKTLTKLLNGTEDEYVISNTARALGNIVSDAQLDTRVAAIRALEGALHKVDEESSQFIHGALKKARVSVPEFEYGPPVVKVAAKGDTVTLAGSLQFHSYEQMSAFGKGGWQLFMHRWVQKDNGEWAKYFESVKLNLDRDRLKLALSNNEMRISFEISVKIPESERNKDIGYKFVVAHSSSLKPEELLTEDGARKYNGLYKWLGDDALFKLPLVTELTIASATPAPASVEVTAEQQEITAMDSLAYEAGLQIPTHPNERYNLLVTSEFFANGELEKHKAKYGDRFDLYKISGGSYKQFVDNILAKAAEKETKTIALVPNDLPAEQLEKLTKVGIRFVRVNTADLQKAKSDKDANREKFQVDTYAMMLLLRRIDKSITADSSIYKLLSFYLKSHFSLTDRIAIDDYIMAIVNNDVARLIKGCLAYRPAQPYETPNYNNVAASLISA